MSHVRCRTATGSAAPATGPCGHSMSDPAGHCPPPTVAEDVSFFHEGGVRHARVRMRKRKDLKIRRGKQVDVVVAGGGFDALDSCKVSDVATSKTGTHGHAPPETAPAASSSKWSSRCMDSHYKL